LFEPLSEEFMCLPEDSIAVLNALADVPREARPAQLEMAAAVADVFADGGILLAEAGTGTGKTLAYLVPAILSRERVLISTGTKNLQEQIFFKDLPALREALGIPVTATLMKGRSNYLCLHRWGLYRDGVDGDTSAAGRLIETGDRVLLPILLYFTSGLIFAYAKPTPVDLRNTKNPRRADMAVSAAGPLSNFLLCVPGILGLVLLRRLQPALPPGILEPLWAVAAAFVMVNFSLGIFNLIPIPPLDGSHVVASIVGEPAQRFFQTIAPFGFMLLILLSYMGALRVVLGPVFQAFGLFLQRVVG
jgi:Zn-dependent protease